MEDQVTDIFGNGELVKKTIVSGCGRDTRPTRGDSVTIEYDTFLVINDDEFDFREDLIEEKIKISFILGDGDVVQALDLAVGLGEKNEIFEVDTESRFAYGSLGNEELGIPPGAKLKYFITLLHSDEPPSYEKMEASEVLAAASKKRDRGNFHYRRQDYALAANSYSKAMTILNTCKDPSTNEGEELSLAILNNIAASQLKTHSYAGAIESSNAVISKCPDNIKAHFRLGNAYFGLTNYNMAARAFLKCIEIDPKVTSARDAYEKCRELLRKNKDREAEFCRRMLGAEGGRDSTKKVYDGGMVNTFKRYKSLIISCGVLSFTLIGGLVYSGRFSAPTVF